MVSPENPRLIAFYLPQYHPIPENDCWWGKGFTEWTNVAKAKPLFKGHYQPHLPADLGFYDLRLPETRQAQADLAKQYGIHGFCYYHYWFNGKQLLERPFKEVLSSGKPDFPFCLCWANENWTRTWDGHNNQVLLAQSYSEDDDRRHIRYLINAFKDPRYILYEGKPIVFIYRASQIPNIQKTLEIWRHEARLAGLNDLYLCRVESNSNEHTNPLDLGFDAAVEFQPDWTLLKKPLRRGKFWRFLARLKISSKDYAERKIYPYNYLVNQSLQKPMAHYKRFPCVTPRWDNSPRKDRGGVILIESSPDLYQNWLTQTLQRAVITQGEDCIVFLNAWNEWAEGNHLEPDAKYGLAYLEATRSALESIKRI